MVKAITQPPPQAMAFLCGCTIGAAAVITDEELDTSLNRHFNGDWGDCDDEDKASNDWASKHNERVLSVYHTAGGTKFWVITDAGGCTTTVLLPEEY